MLIVWNHFSHLGPSHSLPLTNVCLDSIFFVLLWVESTEESIQMKQCTQKTFVEMFAVRGFGGQRDGDGWWSLWISFTEILILSERQNSTYSCWLWVQRSDGVIYLWCEINFKSLWRLILDVLLNGHGIQWKWTCSGESVNFQRWIVDSISIENFNYPGWTCEVKYYNYKSWWIKRMHRWKCTQSMMWMEHFYQK